MLFSQIKGPVAQKRNLKLQVLDVIVEVMRNNDFQGEYTRFPKVTYSQEYQVLQTSVR